MPGVSEERVRTYIASAKRAIENIKNQALSTSKRGRALDVERLIDAAERYVRDAEYYADTGDLETALSAASYAEGLIDSLKYLGLAEPEWPSRDDIRRRVFVGGTFELLHPGHVELLRFASQYGRLYVVIARDSTVERVKGRRPILNEKSRLYVVSSVRYVYEAFLGSENDFLDSVERVRPDIIVLGPDQMFDEEELARAVEARLGYRPEIIRFHEKKEFQRGLRGVRDIIASVCTDACKPTGRGSSPV